MARGMQIDDVSKQMVSLTPESKKAAKKEHKRYLRRQAKNSILNPIPNKYRGFIG